MMSIFANYKKVMKYPTVILTLLAGVNGMILTGDLFNLFVFLEITTISIFILTTSSKKYLETFNYIIIGAVGSSIYLIGIILLYAKFGTLDLQAMSQMVSASSVNLILPLLLIFVGLSVEAKLIPFNGWVKGVYKEANGLVASLMASVVASASLFVMGRLINELLLGQETLSILMMVIAVMTLIGGELSAFKSQSIKEILLYSSIGQAGLITILMVSGLVFPAMIMIINNGVSKLIMFSIGDSISEDNSDINLLKGAFNHHKLLGVSFTVASFSLIGLPLFLGFYAKINSLLGLFETNLFLPLLVLVITIVEGAYLMKLNITLWHPGDEGDLVTSVETKKKDLNLVLIATTLVLSVFILLIGMMPNLLGEKLMVDDLLNETHIDYLIDLKGGM